MTLTLTLTPLPSGKRVRAVLHVEAAGDIQNSFRDLRTDLLYEAITEMTNNAVRGMCNKLEPKLKEMRKQVQ